MKIFAAPRSVLTHAALVALVVASIAGTAAQMTFPPAITITPSAQSLAPGSRATFRADAVTEGQTVAPTYQYQWLFNGSPLAGATNKILNVEKLLPMHAGAYAAHVMSDWGSATSDAAELKVVGSFPYTMTTFAGSGSAVTRDGIGRAAGFREPIGVVSDSKGNLFVTERNVPVIRRITPEGVVTTFAGRAGSNGYLDAQGVNARFNYPGQLAIDSKDNVILADAGNNVIRKVTPEGVVTTLAGKAEFDGQGQRIVGHVDGPAEEAYFNGPWRVAVDKSDNVYVADTWNQVIRKITPAGEVSTFAGTAGSIGSADGGPGEAQFSVPNGLAVDSKGFVYLGDQNNFTIRKITPDGIVSTLAGEAGVSGSADGQGSAARFASPYGLAFDKEDNLYVADGLNHAIRKVTPDGTVVTVAGLAKVTGRTDGIGRLARFNDPGTVVFDAAGNMIVVDCLNNTIRKGFLTSWFQMNVTGNSVLNAPIGPYILESSSDLTNWEPVSSGMSDGTVEFAGSSTSGQRFYRAKTGVELNP